MWGGKGWKLQGNTCCEGRTVPQGSCDPVLSNIDFKMSSQNTLGSPLPPDGRAEGTGVVLQAG